MWKCPVCGAPVPERARFCTNCGAALGEGEAGRESGGGKGVRILLWTVLGVLIFICAVLAAILILRSRSPQSEPASPVVQSPAPVQEMPAAELPAAEPPASVPVAPAPSPILIQTPTPEPPFTGYLDDASRVDDRGLTQLCRVMEDTIAENVRTSWGAPEHLLRSEYAGFYLLTGKSDSAQPRNILVLVYRNDVNISIPAEKVNKNLSYFYCLRFENVWRDEDGSLRLSAPEKPDEQVNANIPGHYFYYKGYATAQELYNYQVGPYLRNYDFSERSLGQPVAADGDPVPDLAEMAERVLAHYRPILSAKAEEQKLYVIFDSEIQEWNGKYLMVIRYQGSPTTSNVYVADVSVEKDTGRVSSSLPNDSPWNLW